MPKPRRIAVPTRDGTGDTDAPARPAAREPVLSLQRMIGNRAVGHVLLRQPRVSPTADDLSRIAKAENAGRIPGVKLDAKDINVATKPDKDKIKTGLNLVANLSARGRTGFVNSKGEFVGDLLPVTLDDPLPTVAIMIAHQTFDSGDADARTTMRHELKHAEHALTLIAWLDRFRKHLKDAKVKVKPTADLPKAFRDWAKAQKSVSEVERELVVGGAEGKGFDTARTETLAHIEGLIAAVELSDIAPSDAVITKPRMPPVAEQLRGAAINYSNLALKSRESPAVSKAAIERVKDAYKQMSREKRALVRDWLFYIHDRAKAKPSSAKASTDEERAAKIVHSSFSAGIKFLEDVLAALREVRKDDFAARKLAAPQKRTIVTVKGKPTRQKLADVKPGTVLASIDVAYDISGTGPRSHGTGLRYEGTDADQVRWLQFIWREVVPEGGKPLPGELEHQSKKYPLTTDPSDPAKVGWNVDTATYLGGIASAFYETDNSVNRTSSSIEIFDEPSPPLSDVKRAFTANPKPKSVKSRAHIVDYLVRDYDVLYRVEIVFEHEFKSPDDNPPAKPSLVSHRAAGRLDPGPRARLGQLFPSLDYLP